MIFPTPLLLYEPDGSINYNNISSFSVADYGILGSYATTIPSVEGLRTGANVKVVYRKAGSFAQAIGFGFDVGAQYEVGEFQLGAMIRDVTTTFNTWSYSFTQEEKNILSITNNEIPVTTFEYTLPKVIIGAAWEKEFKEKFKFIAALDMDLNTDGKRNVLIAINPVSIDPHLGMELGYGDFIFARIGAGNFQKATRIGNRTKETLTMQPNIGLGLRLKNIDLDYAFTDIGDQSAGLYSHVFSLKLNINKTINE